jgi:predicted ribosomally synthesized peptide with SipW-like signal peptide
LSALGTIGAASAGAGLGTSAYFSDKETFEKDDVGDAEALAEQAPDGYTGLPANDAWLVAVDDPGQFLANTQYDAYNDAEGDLTCTDIGGA